MVVDGLAGRHLSFKYYRSGIIKGFIGNFGVKFPIGNILLFMTQFIRNITDREYMKELTTETVGNLVRKTRKRLNLTQRDLALTSATGLRFIIELEQGKSTCQFGKVLTVLQSLGIRVDLRPPAATISESDVL
ncbi:MAG TPA: hypothetical protein VK658_28750 [Chryseolinea sp.]|nr:hypothetical protein [Chryseolinea sp.]